jgi:hypothetical protein
MEAQNENLHVGLTKRSGHINKKYIEINNKTWRLKMKMERQPAHRARCTMMHSSNAVV